MTIVPSNTKLLAILTLCLAGCSAPGPPPRERPAEAPRRVAYRPYTFTLNGEPFEPKVLSAHGDPARPRPGDAVLVKSVWLRLGETRQCHFVTRKDRPHQILLRGAGSTLRRVGLTVAQETVGDAPKLVDKPLASLSPRAVRALWGVRLQGWSAAVARQLRHLHGSCLTVNQGRGPKHALPSLPRKLECLVIDDWTEEMQDVRALGQLTNLRVLSVSGVTSTPTGLQIVGRLRRLRHLTLSYYPLKSLASLAQLIELRELDLNGVDKVGSLAFLRALRKLRRLNLDGTGVVDLSPITGLRHLHTVRADNIFLHRLPLVSMPRLRTLRILSTKLAPASVQRFRRLNPRCRVLHGYGEVLRHAIRATTRIRIRSNISCGRRVEKTLGEVRKPVEINSFLAKLRVVEPDGLLSCACCGHPALELYAGTKLLGTIIVHHGYSLRWSGWPGNAHLTRAARTFLVRWLARHGAPELLQRWKLHELRMQSRKRRTARYRELVPPATWNAMRGVKSVPKAVEILRTAVRKPHARTRFFLRLFGCHDDAWAILDGYDEALTTKLIPSLPQATLLAVIRKIIQQARQRVRQQARRRAADRRRLPRRRRTTAAAAVDRLRLDALRGAARWVLGYSRAARLLKKLGPKRFVTLARVGLSSPRRANQHRAVYMLATHLKRRAIPLLRMVYRGQLQPRTRPAIAQTDPPGTVGRVDAEALCSACSAQAVAAHFLAQLGDRTLLRSLPARIRKAKGHDKKLYQNVLHRLLGKKTSPARPDARTPARARARP